MGEVAFVCVVALFSIPVVALMWAVRSNRKKSTPAETPTSKREFKHYGHPFPPVPTVSKALPKPPASHAWEVFAKRDKTGELFIHVNLVNLTTTVVAATKSMSLVYRPERCTGTWASCYRSLRYRSNQEGWFLDDLVGPFTDWAAKEAGRAKAGDVEDYTMRAG